MKVPEATIAEVVAATAQHLQQAEYISGRVDELIKVQPKIMQYVVAQKGLTVPEVVQTLFHAWLIHESVTRAAGAPPALVDFSHLDSAATVRPTLEALSEEEPFLASYIYTNVDMDSGKAATQHAGKILAHVAKAFVDRMAQGDDEANDS